MSGYGRGFYGEAQLSRPPRKRNWFAIAAFLGIGVTAAWLLWPRKSSLAYGGTGGGGPFAGTQPTSPTTSPHAHAHSTMLNVPAEGMAIVPLASATGAFLAQVEQDARVRGFMSVKDYEDALIATSKELQASGAKITLAPHLQHLAPQLGP